MRLTADHVVAFMAPDQMRLELALEPLAVTAPPPPPGKGKDSWTLHATS